MPSANPISEKVLNVPDAALASVGLNKQTVAYPERQVTYRLKH